MEKYNNRIHEIKLSQSKGQSKWHTHQQACEVIRDVSIDTDLTMHQTKILSTIQERRNTSKRITLKL